MTRISWETACAFDVMGNVPYSLKREIYAAMENHERFERT